MSLAPSSKLYKFLQENPSEESYRHAIQLPQDTRLEDWLSVVTIEIFDNLTRIYSLLSEYCIDNMCPIMSIGLSHEYLWNEYQDTNSSIKHNKIHCSAPQYIHLFIIFVKETISNTSIFPTQQSPDSNEYASNFLSIIHFICKHMFRVFGHLYCNHLSSITSLQLHLYLNTCFKHYLYFIEEFELIQATQLKPLKRYIQISLGRSFGKKYRKPSQPENNTNNTNNSDPDPNITAFSSIDHSSHISSLSLPKSPKSSHSVLSNTILAEKTNPTNSLATIQKNISIEIDTEYKDNDASSVSIVSSMNSITCTPYPTYRQPNGEVHMHNNRSIYEYVFHREKEKEKEEGINEEEEKACEDYIQKTGYRRKCKIIRNKNAFADNYNNLQLPRIPLLSSGDCDLKGNENTFVFSPYTQITDDDIAIMDTNDKNELNITPITPTPPISPTPPTITYNKSQKVQQSEIDSPSFRDVVFYRSQVRKLQSEVNVLKDENKELKLNGQKKKKKKKRKKPEKEANMAKLVDIMNSMNEQITKLAEAVTEAVHISDDDEKIEYDNDKKDEFDDDELCFNVNQEKNYLRKDLREYFLEKVLNTEQ